MGRRSKLTPELQAQIVEAVAHGALVEDVCQAAGISEPTYYKWMKRARDEKQRVSEDARRSIRKSEKKYVEFLEAVTQAQARAREQSAQAWWAGGTQVRHEVKTTVKTFTETRLRKDKDGNEVPYQYTREEKTVTVDKKLPDWRANEAYLKRRDPPHWGDAVTLRGDENAPIPITQIRVIAPELPESTTEPDDSA